MLKFPDGISIVGTGSYVPDKIVSNFDLEKMVDTTDEWITTRTGIQERRIAQASEAASDLALKAGSIALKQAGIAAKEVDLLIVATQSPDYQLPSTAAVIQPKLGLKNAVCFDISAACSGAIYALIMAESLMKTCNYNTAMIIGTDVLSKSVDWSDRSTCVLFGDGAGAIVLKMNIKGRNLISFDWGSDGSGVDFLKIPAGGSRNPILASNIDQNQQYLKMDGKKVYKHATDMMYHSVLRALNQAQLKKNNIDLLIPHQANIRILKTVAKKLSLPQDKIMINLDKYGNTAAASIPIALDEAIVQGKIQSGDIVVLTAFGAGLTWGSIILCW
ncbi:MAG: ketoacyl-ACP synthase III [Candidatus Cloacimonetes bacterium]|jgi:3-oxoacyl-[acyl-carrier-protein] synthase-3|nr:ketoacyl-ACP synthase III [Candidatus Cloacimonadota bacterium]MDK2851708.1 3-oxoacyl-[acyl-carrier-protein] synthase [Candidatus Cloacimonadota bacterium]